MRAEGWLALALASASCASAGPLPADRRAVSYEEVERSWSAAAPSDLHGVFESVEITGDAAGALLRIYYCFNADRTYSGAALTTGAEHSEFTTLGGSWELVGGELVLDGGERLSASVSGDRLKLENDRGRAVLRRASVE
jgi:hypothetical protein